VFYHAGLYVPLISQKSHKRSSCVLLRLLVRLVIASASVVECLRSTAALLIA